MKLEFLRTNFRKMLNIKFHENPSNGSRVVACGRTEMMKLIVAFRNFANAPNYQVIYMNYSNITQFPNSFIYIEI